MPAVPDQFYRQQTTGDAPFGVGAFLAVCLVFVAALTATPAAAEPISRTVIAIHNGSQFDYELDAVKPRTTSETPLNHLGLQLVHHDWHALGAPDDALSDPTRGALVWMTGMSMEDPDAFLDWATAYMRSGKRLVLAGDFAFLRDTAGVPADPARLDAFFEALGLRFNGRYLDDFDPLTIAEAEEDVVGFERALPTPLPSAPVVEATGAETRVFLAIADEVGQRSDLVARTGGGGILFGAYTHRHYSAAGLSFWFIDPITVFRSVFDMDGLPVPDTTTIVGRRIYTSHVDGDGWGSISRVADRNGVMRTNAEIMYDRLIEPYPDLPVSVGAISGDLAPSLLGTRGNRDVARQIFALPQVELATHTHTHPFDWGFFRPSFYNPETEARLFGGTTGQRSLLENQTGQFMDILSDRDPVEAMYEHPDYNVPRAYYDGPFDVRQEIDTSIEIIEALAPEGKKVELVLWSGNTSPFPEVLAHVREAGLENMNGGMTRYDSRFPSLSYISPLTRTVGGETQVFTAMASEAFYTDYWTRRFYGFRELIQTIDNTGAPVRLRPVQLYYHTYAVERPESLEAMLAILDHVRTLDVAPLEASRYAAIVQGAMSARIEATETGFRISDRGALNTLRFDGPARPQIDYEASTGILGHRDEGSVRYVALDPAVDTITLTVDNGQIAPSKPYLVESRWPISGASIAGNEARFSARGYGAGSMRWAFPEPCTGEALVTQPDGSVDTVAIVSDAKGDVVLTLDNAPMDGVEITLTCRTERA